MKLDEIILYNKYDDEHYHRTYFNNIDLIIESEKKLNFINL